MASKKIGYTISSVAEIYEIHPQTLRGYERQGLLQPSRSDGNTRLYTQDDLTRLEMILNLTRDLGVNLAGVEVILNMRAKMEKMQKEVEQLLEYLRIQVELDPEFLEPRLKDALVRVSPATLVHRPKS
ncbi:MAG: helix-turn-helix transcriptional regulator [Acidobacteriota bacterium]